MSAARLSVCAALLAAFAPGVVASQTPAPSPPARRDDATALSGITVMAPEGLAGLIVNGRRRCILAPPPGEKPPQPRAVSSYPAQGAVVRPGKLYVRITYSERMSPCGFLLANAALAPEPDFLEEPALLTRDYKSFYFAVTTEPGKTYGLRFNTFLAHNFRSLLGPVAPAYTLTFRTSDAEPSRTMQEAMAGDSYSADIAQHPEALLVLWTPRENGEGPDCGSCDDAESTLKVQPPLKALK